MAQKWLYSTPQACGPDALSIEVIQVEKMRLPDWYIRIAFKDDQGRILVMKREGVTAAKPLIIALNTNNNAVKSEEQRIFEWAVTQPDGIAAGAINGSPDA